MTTSTNARLTRLEALEGERVIHLTRSYAPPAAGAPTVLRLTLDRNGLPSVQRLPKEGSACT